MPPKPAGSSGRIIWSKDRSSTPATSCASPSRWSGRAMSIASGVRPVRSHADRCLRDSGRDFPRHRQHPALEFEPRPTPIRDEPRGLRSLPAWTPPHGLLPCSRGRPIALPAVQYFERAIAKDGNYAIAYAGMADAFIAMERNMGTASPWVRRPLAGKGRCGTGHRARPDAVRGPQRGCLDSRPRIRVAGGRAWVPSARSN